MIHTSSKIQSLVKKVKKREAAGFHLLMGCSASDVVDQTSCVSYSKLDERSRCTRTDVPKGCLAVYVGDERQRYIIQAHLLNHPVFRSLLEQSANEFGFRQSGGIKFTCDTRQFEHLLWLAKQGDSSSCTNFNNTSLVN